MSLTYSINVGQPTESFRKSDIYNVLQDLPDNTSKLISPKDVRDAFLSTWSNSAFKITTPSTYSTAYYIGVDSGNPADRDQKSKILLGKRQYGNLDILSTGLINNSQTDVFVYNTKSDSVTQSSTRMAFLAGTNSLLFNDAPYIEGFNSNNVGISLNIVNPNPYDGVINILSTTGRVAINGVVFPTLSETAASASNGRILRYFGTYPNGFLKWDEPTISNVVIGNPGSTTSIYGSPVLVNGYSLEFVDKNQVPVKIGDFDPGDTFATGSFAGQDWPLSEVIRGILYPYLQPELEISVLDSNTGLDYAPINTNTTLSITYSVKTFAREDNESISDYHIKLNSNYFYGGTSFSATPSSVISSSFSYLTFSSTALTWNFELVATTIPGGTISSGHSFSSTSNFKWVLPVYYGFTTSVINDSSTLTNVSSGLSSIALLNTPQTVSLSMTGSGYIYFIYPSTFTNPIKMIKDPNGFILYDQILASFSSFTSSSYLNTSLSQNYEVWSNGYLTNYNGSGNFEIKF
jgi:hypothetical protein